jgi:proteasome lid subunit RPN8/RPN11
VAELPKIIGETRREIKEREPPPVSQIAPHQWATDRCIEQYNQAIHQDGFVDAYIAKTAVDKIRNHCLKNSQTEVMGLLIGDIFKFQDRIYSVVFDVVTTDLDATAVHVKFDEGGFEQLFEKLDDVKFDYIIVGWYHSHPGHTCFLSETDIATQKKHFNAPYHIALVLDPRYKKIACYKLSKDAEYEERPFAVYWSRYEDPYVSKPHIIAPLLPVEVVPPPCEPVSPPQHFSPQQQKAPPPAPSSPSAAPIGKNFITPTDSQPSPQPGIAVDEKPKSFAEKYIAISVLLPILLGILGGAIAYYVEKDKNERNATRLFLIGILAGIIWLVIGAIITDTI